MEPKTFDIQINWNGRWITVQTNNKSRDEAEWLAGLWKQQHQCHGDPFRVVESEPEPEAQWASDEDDYEEFGISPPW